MSCFKMDIRLNFQVFVLLMVWLGCSYAAPPLPVNCPISSTHKCACTVGLIDCVGHNLSVIPTFTTSLNSFGTIKLGHNNIKHIPANAFSAINVTEIDLTANGIATVDLNAFSGVTSSLKKLVLANNSLSALPEAFSTLINLVELDVSWNPIKGATPAHGHHGHGSDGLTDDVMRVLAKTVTKFSFGSNTMTSWPTSLSHLNALKDLTVTGMNLPYWPANTFHGFEQTLESLTIDGAILAAVPSGISSLTQLKKLHLDHLNVSPTFGDDSMINAPFDSLSQTLTELSLTYDGLTTFPEEIQYLGKLTNLSLDGNNLEFVSDEAIKLLRFANVTTLSLKDCNLKRSPGAISDLRNLQTLDLANNKIRSIESTDLRNLDSLATLTLNLNPLIYISDNFSCGLHKLQHFNLRNTSLTQISQSFKNLIALRTLDLTNSKIDCTCDLTWLNYWKHNCTGSQNVNLLGSCETIKQEIGAYVDNRLLTCPGFTTDIDHFKCPTGRGCS